MKPFALVVSIEANSFEEAEAVREEIAGAVGDGRESGLFDDTSVTLGDLESVDIETVLENYRKLHDGLSDMIEEGRLTEAGIPDDYQWLVEKLAELAVKDATRS